MNIHAFPSKVVEIRIHISRFLNDKISKRSSHCVHRIAALMQRFKYDKPEKILQFLHISSTIKKNVGGCVHVTYR